MNDGKVNCGVEANKVGSALSAFLKSLSVDGLSIDAHIKVSYDGYSCELDFTYPTNSK